MDGCYVEFLVLLVGDDEVMLGVVGCLCVITTCKRIYEGWREKACSKEHSSGEESWELKTS